MQPSPCRPVRETLLLWRELKRVDVRRLVTGIDVAQFLKTLQEQRRTDEENQRERSLSDDENVSAPSTTAGVAARSLAEPHEIGR
jgi:hypothetical protein